MKMLKVIILLLLLFTSSLYSQLAISMSTDKDTYEYGEVIELECRITNTADTTFRFFAPSYSSCHAHFTFNDFDSKTRERCAATTQLLVFKPLSSLVYTWNIDPMVYGLPNNEGIQEIIGGYFFDLSDTIYINAPQFLGGQLSVGYFKIHSDSVQYIKDSLGIEVLHQSDYNEKYSEIWQVVGHQIDSLIKRFGTDSLLNYMEKSVIFEYESMEFENLLDFFPLQIGNKWIYKVTDINVWENDTSDSFTYRYEEVVGDTLLADGFQYFVVKVERRSSFGYQYYRIDMDEMIIYDEHGTDLYYLNAVPDSLWTDQYGQTNRMTLDTSKVGEMDIEKPLKIYEQSPGGFFNRTLAEGIGVSFMEYGDIGLHTIRSLVYSKIDGVEYGEIPDTNKSSNEFFPLEIGNEWHFRSGQVYGGEGDSSIAKIIGKKTMLNGNTYFQFEYGFLHTEYVRNDGNWIYFYDEDKNHEMKMYNMKAEIGDVHSQTLSPNGNDSIWVTLLSSDTVEVFGYKTHILTFKYDELVTFDVIFSDKFGPISKSYGLWQPEIEVHSLSGCIISDITYGVLLDVDKIDGMIPQEYSLQQNYPNPFNPSTKISYSIPEQRHVSLKVFDILGREVKSLVNKEQPSGNYEVEFDASILGSGVYFYRIQAGQFVESKKMVLLK